MVDLQPHPAGQNDPVTTSNHQATGENLQPQATGVCRAEPPSLFLTAHFWINLNLLYLKR